MASVNQTRPHRVNQMGKTHSKPLAAWHDRGTAWARHGNGMLCVNRPLIGRMSIPILLVTIKPCRFFTYHFVYAGNGIIGGMITIFHQMTFKLEPKLKSYELHTQVV